MLNVIYQPNIPKVNINFQKIYSVCQKLVKNENLSKDINLVLTNNKEIRFLNKNYRHKDSVTDVLSFLYLDNEFPAGEKTCLGEIIISMEQAHKQAKKYKYSLKKELTKLFIHGLLHLCGHTHENEEEYKKMKIMEQNVLKYCQKY